MTSRAYRHKRNVDIVGKTCGGRCGRDFSDIRIQIAGFVLGPHDIVVSRGWACRGVGIGNYPRRSEGERGRIIFSAGRTPAIHFVYNVGLSREVVGGSVPGKRDDRPTLGSSRRGTGKRGGNRIRGGAATATAGAAGAAGTAGAAGAGCGSSAAAAAAGIAVVAASAARQQSRQKNGSRKFQWP